MFHSCRKWLVFDSSSCTGSDITLGRAHHLADAPPVGARRARRRAQLAVAAGTVGLQAMRLGRASVPLC